jgi:hypothetical protein
MIAVFLERSSFIGFLHDCIEANGAVTRLPNNLSFVLKVQKPQLIFLKTIVFISPKSLGSKSSRITLVD